MCPRIALMQTHAKYFKMHIESQRLYHKTYILPNIGSRLETKQSDRYKSSKYRAEVRRLQVHSMWKHKFLSKQDREQLKPVTVSYRASVYNCA